MIKLPTTPISFNEVNSLTFQLFKATFMKVWPLLLISFLCMAVLNLNHSLWVSAKIILMIIPFIVIFIALIYHTHHLLWEKRQVNAIKTLSIIAKKWVPLLLGTLFFAVLTSVGFALILPGIYLYVIAGLYFAIIVIDDADPIAALKQLFKLVWGRWWWIATAYSIPFVLLFLASLIIVIPIYGIHFLFPQLDMFLLTIFYLIDAVLATVWLLVNAAITVLVLNDLKIRANKVSQ